MPVHHVKEQPAAPTYVQKKRCFTFYTNRATPCICEIWVPKKIRSEIEFAVFRVASCISLDLTKCYHGILSALKIKMPPGNLLILAFCSTGMAIQLHFCATECRAKTAAEI